MPHVTSVFVPSLFIRLLELLDLEFAFRKKYNLIGSLITQEDHVNEHMASRIIVAATHSTV